VTTITFGVEAANDAQTV